MDKLMRKLLQLEAFEIRTLAIQYYWEYHKWPSSFEALIKEVEYNGADSLYQSGWSLEIGWAEGATSYTTITVTHESGVTRTFCVDLPLYTATGDPIVVV